MSRVISEETNKKEEVRRKIIQELNNRFQKYGYVVLGVGDNILSDPMLTTKSEIRREEVTGDYRVREGVYMSITKLKKILNVLENADDIDEIKKSINKYMFYY